MITSSLLRRAPLSIVCLALFACSNADGVTGDGGVPDASAQRDADSATSPVDASPPSAVDSGTDAGSEAPASCLPLLQPRAGTYPVTGPASDPSSRGASTASHQRGTVVVAADGAIDFDTALAQSAKAISVCYDRTSQSTDRRVQVSYGANDDDLVVNLYLSSAGAVEEIQYRHRAKGVNVRALVGAPTR